MSLEGKIAIVTGAARGIGRAIAERLAAEGARVWAVDRDRQGLSEVPASETAMADVGRAADVGKVIEDVLAKDGRIDLLINNAGIGGQGRHLVDVGSEEWEEMLRVNLGSVFLMCRATVPQMVRQSAGCIVNLSSMFALSGAAGSTPYAAAKAGVIGFSKSLARELAPHRVTVNVVAPGIIDTPMFRARGIEPGPPWLLWPRIGQPADVAGVVAFLCSDEAEFITGQVISPNGGGWM
jgi:NAD(P)-dependent dehydrogenase (short-subunit alcohol dehydrogenase family)